MVHFIQLLLVIAILVTVGLPLFAKAPARPLFAPRDSSLERYKHLLVRKEEVLLSIKELELDSKTGKVSGEDCAHMRAKLEEEALNILQEIDLLEKERRSGKKSGADAATA